jgi:hypothetical protein
MVHMGVLPAKTDLPPAGKLWDHVDTWKVITRDMWVLDTIRGYHIDFLWEPHQPALPHSPQCSEELIVEELKELLGKGAIAEVQNPQGGFYSNLFLVPKKDGGQRPVINLKALNSFVQTEHFKMEEIHTLRDLVNPEDWLAKVDLKDAYFAIPIHQSHRQYLRFYYQEKCYQFQCLPFGLSSAPWVFTKTLKEKCYQFQCLPFGLSSAPCVFTKTLKPVIALLREIGVRLIAYIDDILVLAESKELASSHAEALVYLLQCLGFRVNQKKSVLEPAQAMEFLGLTYRWS